MLLIALFDVILGFLAPLAQHKPIYLMQETKCAMNDVWRFFDEDISPMIPLQDAFELAHQS